VDRLGHELGGKGRNETAISSARLTRITQLLAYCKRRKIPWWIIQSPPIVMKLVAYAK
jgi:hypothetical protein